MIPLNSAISSGFTWTKRPHNSGYELQRGNEVIGTLHRPSVWSSNFVAETSRGKWMFRRTGFFGTGAEIAEFTTGHQLAVFKSSWGMQGVLTFEDGQTFHFECKGVWHPVWNITSDNGEPVLSLHSREKNAESRACSVAEDRLLLLTTFALYRVWQAEEDAASAAVVAVFS